MNQEWINHIDFILDNGELVNPRGMSTYEVIGMQFTCDMNQPILSILERQVGYKHMAREAWWILSGDNSVENMPAYKKYSDDGKRLFGAYGPKIIDQISYCENTLKNDLFSRQAVLNIWRENPRQSKDIPCTLSMQFLIRNQKLYCVVNMRSSDAWLGIPYDVFVFSMVSLTIAQALNVSLGKLCINIGSAHVYEQDANTYAAIPMFTEINYSIDLKTKPIHWCYQLMRDNYGSLGSLFEARYA